MQKEEAQFDLDFGPGVREKEVEPPTTSLVREDGEISDHGDEDNQSFDAAFSTNEVNKAPLSSEPRKKCYDNNHRKSYHRSTRYQRNDYSRTLFVGDLSKDVTQDGLTTIFQKYGKIIDVDVKYLKFGVTTYAFIQYIDPLCSISAYQREQGCKLNDQLVKVGFGRATPSDTLWLGGLSSEELAPVTKNVRELHGLRWVLTDTSLLQSIFKFDSLADCSFAFEWARGLTDPKGLLSDFLSFYACKEFISRASASGQQIDPSILDEVNDAHRPQSHRNRLQNSPSDTREDSGFSSRKNRRHELLRSGSLSPLSRDTPRKRRVPTWALRSPISDGSSASSRNSRDDHLSRREETRSAARIWVGKLILKSKSINVSFYFFKGNRRVFDACLCDIIRGHEKIGSLKIGQRMKLDDEQLLLIGQRLKRGDDTAFAIAGVHDKMSENVQSLKTDFVDYFTQKDAAGVVHILDSKHNEMTHILYLFPPCSFVNKHTRDITSDLRSLIEGGSFLLVLAVRCN